MTEAFRVLAGAGTFTPTGAGATHWVEHLRTAHFSIGTYSIPAGGVDGQSPHREDEIYLIASGVATLDVDGHPVPVAAGSVVFVAAQAPHRFVDIAEDLVAVVLFAPPESVAGS
jgi:mannose-6-phosphate isomerase-like protein (cupin superfamily)